MATGDTLSPSAAWAARVTPRQYATHRPELDELVLAAVPAYAKSVHARLDELAASVAASRETYDRNHSAPQFIRPWRVRWAQNALLWAYLLGILISFGLMFPIGGRSTGNINYDAIDWALAVMLSSIFFVVGVMAQLARRFPIVPGVPPRKDLAWLPTVFGVPTIVMMIVNFTVEENVQPGWIALTGAAVLVSVIYCLTRVAQRGLNPTLTRLVHE